MSYENYVKMAKDSFKAYESLLKSGLERDAVSRGYYAVFYLSLALLLKNKESSLPKTHSGLVARLWELRDKLKIDQKIVQELSRLQAIREKSDYAPIFLVTANDIKRVKWLYEALSKVLGV